MGIKRVAAIAVGAVSWTWFSLDDMIKLMWIFPPI